VPLSFSPRSSIVRTSVLAIVVVTTSSGGSNAEHRYILDVRDNSIFTPAPSRIAVNDVCLPGDHPGVRSQCPLTRSHIGDGQYKIQNARSTIMMIISADKWNILC
jgi:hypothetical protein